MSLEAPHRFERGPEASAEADGAVVYEYMGRGLAIRDLRHMAKQPMPPQPPPRVRRVPGREDDDAETG
jgi:hypothetical protein